VTGDSGFGEYNEVAKRLGIQPTSVAVAVHRLRQRYRQLIRDEVLLTVTEPVEADTEITHLIQALKS